MKEETPLLGSQFVFYRCPWLVTPVERELVDFLKAVGRSRRFAAHTEFPFGAHDKVWLVASGLLATCVGGFAGFGLMSGLWPENVVLGANRAVVHGRSSMNLGSRMLSDVELLEVEGDVFRDFIERDLELCNRLLRNFLLQNNALMEGTLVNDVLPVRQRLAIVLCVLAKAAGKSVLDGPVQLPWPITIQEFAMLVNSDRTVVGRIFSGWESAGIIGHRGRFTVFDRRILNEIPENRTVE